MFNDIIFKVASNTSQTFENGKYNEEAIRPIGQDYEELDDQNDAVKTKREWAPCPPPPPNAVS